MPLTGSSLSALNGGGAGYKDLSMPIAQRRSSSGSATADANTATENMESTTRHSSVSSSAQIPFARALKRSTSFATARAREVRDPCPNVGIKRALSLKNMQWGGG